MSFDYSDKCTKFFTPDENCLMDLDITKHQAFGYTVTKTFLEDRNIYRLDYNIDINVPINKEIIELEQVYDEGEDAVKYMTVYLECKPSRSKIKNALKSSAFTKILLIFSLIFAALFIGLGLCFHFEIITVEKLLEYASVSIPEGSPITMDDLTNPFFTKLFSIVGGVFLVFFVMALINIIRSNKEINITYRSECKRFDSNCEYFKKHIEEVKLEMDELYTQAQKLVAIRDDN